MNEYIRMCDCPEVQGKWEPKIGDRVWHKKRRSLATATYTKSFSEDLWVFSIISGTENEKTALEDVLYIPRIEDLLELSDDILAGVGKHHLGWDIDENETSTHDLIIVSLLKDYMHLEHNKTWNGEAWV